MPPFQISIETVKKSELETWTSQKPVPKDLEIIIDNAQFLKIRIYLESKGLEYPSQTRYHNLILQSLQNEDNLIGTGGKGRVYSFSSPDGDDKRICIKVMKHPKDSYHIADRGNHPIEEFRMQSEIAFLNEGTSTKYPRPLQLLDCNHEFFVFVMEELPALNLQEVMLGRLDLPDVFDIKLFMDRLYEYVDELHELGIVHNDLEARNVMVDRSTGTPYIIDFGRSVRIDYKEESQHAKKLRAGDYSNLERIESDLYALKHKKNKGIV